MKIGKETITVLLEKPSIPPNQGYIFFYSWKDKLWYMDSNGQEYLLPGAGGLLNQLIEGSYVWVSGLTFDVSICFYLIQANTYESVADTIELDAAHETLNRIDVIYLDVDGLVGKITGTPAESPAKPLVDPHTQLELTNVYVPAGGTEPGGISNGYVYQENTEWTTSANSITGVGVNFASTTNPNSGTKCIEVKRNGPGNTGWKGQYLKFVRPTGTESILNSAMVLSIRNARAWRKGDKVELTLNLGTSVISANKVILKDGVYGFNSALTASWQKLVIPIADFAPVSYNVDTLYILFNGAFSAVDNVVGFDDIYFQAGNTQVTGHDRLHEMTSPLDHKPVAAAFYDKILHTNALTGAWELIDMPTGTESAYVYIGYASDANGTGFSMTPGPTLKYVAFLNTTSPLANPQASDFDGLWEKYIGDDGAPGTPGDPGAPGAPGADGDDAYVYIAYASDANGTGFTMTFTGLHNFIAIKTTTTPIANPVASDFTGLWKQYAGEVTPGPHYTYVAWCADPENTLGFTLTANLTLPFEAILITHTEISEPSAADFVGLWRPRVTATDLYTGWNLLVDYDETEEQSITNGTTVYFKRGEGIELSGYTDEVDRQVVEIKATGSSGGGSTHLTAIPITDKTASGITTNLVANENQAFGDIVRINAAGKAQIAKADVIANATALAMCVDETILADATGKYLLLGFVRNDAWDFTIGEWIYLSLIGTTGNTLTQENPADNAGVVEDNVIQMLGVANSADSFYFNPQLVQVEWKPSNN